MCVNIYVFYFDLCCERIKDVVGEGETPTSLKKTVFVNLSGIS